MSADYRYVHPGPSRFHPHRVFPRYARALRYASSIPGALPRVSRVLEDVAFDRAPAILRIPT